MVSGPSDDDPGAQPPEPQNPPPAPPPADETRPRIDLGKHREPTEGAGAPPPAYPGGGAEPPPGYPPPGYPPPGYPPGGYGAPSPGYPPAYGAYPGARRPNNGLCLASIVTGVISIGCCPLLGPIAIFLGIRGRRQAKENGEEGETLGLIGLITGGVGTVILVVTVAIYVLFGLLAFATSSTSTRRPATNLPTLSRPSTTTSGRSGTTLVAPGSTLPLVVCARMRTALDDLENPTASTNDRLNVSAAVLVSELGADRQEDVTTLLIDGRARVGVPGAASNRPGPVSAAAGRLDDAVEELCGP